MPAARTSIEKHKHEARSSRLKTASRPPRYEEDEKVSDEASPELSEAAQELKRRVQDVYESIGGNTADGRWSLISRMLKLPCTRGHYSVWIAPRAHEVPEPKEEEINNENIPEETVAAEEDDPDSARSTRKIREARLKEKVQSWQQNVAVETEALRTETDSTRGRTKPQSPKKKAIDLHTGKHADPDRSPLGFTVQKNTNISSQSKAKSKAGQPKKPAVKDVSSSSQEREPVSRRKIITDIPEQSFLPPMFSSSQIEHSTPVRNFASLRTPDSIPHATTDFHDLSDAPLPPQTSSPPLHSTRPALPIPHSRNPLRESQQLPSPPGEQTPIPKVDHSPSSSSVGVARLSAQPEAGPSSIVPFINEEVDPVVIGTKRQRPSSPSVDRQTKARLTDPSTRLRRTTKDPYSSPLSSLPKTPTPSTPQKHVPTLTELLSLSAKKNTSPKGKHKAASGLDVHPVTRSQHSSRPKPKDKEIKPRLLSQGKDKIETQRTTTTATSIQPRQPGWENFSVPHLTTEDPYSLHSPPGHTSSNPKVHAHGINAHSTPTGMEDGEDAVSIPRSSRSTRTPRLVPDSPPLPDFTFDQDAFEPPFTSTQQKAQGKVRPAGDADVFLDTRTPSEQDMDVLMVSPKRPKLTPVRGGAARYSSETQSQLSRLKSGSQSRSPTKSPAKSQTQSFPWGYSSQMDLEGGVDRVGRMLDNDLSMMSVNEDDERQDTNPLGRKGWIV